MQIKSVTKQVLLAALLNASELCGQSYHTLASTGYYVGTGKDGKAIDNFFFRASLPLKMKNGNYLLLNPDVHRQTFNFDTGRLYKAYKTGLVLAYMKMLKKGNMIGIVNISNNYVEGSMGQASFQIGAGVLITRPINKALKIKYGLYGNREFFGALLVPLLGLDYKISDKMRLFGVLPQNMKLEMKHKQWLRYGAVFETPLNTYWQSTVQNNRYIDQRQILLGVFSDFYITKHLVLQAVVKQPIFNSQKIFYSHQQYDMSVLGIGMGGSRNAQTEPQAFFQHRTVFEMSLNYRIETE